MRSQSTQVVGSTPFNSCVFRRSDLTICSCTDSLAGLAGHEQAADLVGAFIIDLFSPLSLAPFERFLRAGDFSKTVQCKMATSRSTDDAMLVLISPPPGSQNRDMLTLSCVPVPDYATTISKLEGQVSQLQGHNARLTELANLLAHDLRGSLHAILGNLDLLLHREADNLTASAHSHIDRIRRAASGMNRVLDDVNKLMRVKGGDFPMELTDMNALVDGIITESEAMISPGTAIRRVSDLPTVMCHEHLIRELLRNIIENSIKYGGAKPVVIEVGATQDETPTYLVRDNGVGISSNDLPSVQMPLTRADHDGLNTHGTGMGLALVRAIVLRHGGHVWIESERGHGTTVWFTLSKHGDAAPER